MSDLNSAPTTPRGLTGMNAFRLIWFGQFISLVGSGMTQFAISLWAWEKTGKATALALTLFFAYMPAILFSPIAGALADRWNRKLVMMISDLAAGMSTIVLLILNANGSLDIWHIYAASAFAGLFGAFQMPAYGAAITLMVDKSQYGRTSAMMGLAHSASGIIAPIAAASLYVFVALNGIMIIDIVTFSFAVISLLFIYIPSPKISEEGKASRGNLLQESMYGFRYIWRRKPLLSMSLMFFVSNILYGFVLSLMAPYILARTGNDGLQLSAVNVAAAIGAILGGILLTAWGGPKRQVHGIFIGFLVWSFLGAIAVGITQNLIVWIVLALITGLSQPLIDTSSQAIWQRKVPPDIQGKVFSVRRLIGQIPALLSFLLAGPLADYLFEPAMQPDGALAPIFGGMVGTGAGAGIGLIFVIAGILELLVILKANTVPILRDVDTLVVDHDVSADAAA